MDVISSSIAAAAAQQQYERGANIGASQTTTTTTYLVPSTTAPLQLEPFTNATNFLTTNPVQSQAQHHSHHQQHHNQQQQQQQQQQTNSSTTSSYTFVQIKREPCQVSEITSNCQQRTNQQSKHHNHHNHHHQQHQTTVSTTTSATTGNSTTQHHQHQQHHHHQHHHQQQHQQHHSVGTVSSTSKTMSSSTLTTLVKIEASSPKVQEMDKSTTTTSSSLTATSNSVPIGIAVARKRQQETSTSNTLPPLCNSSSLPLQQSLNKDLNCIGIRVSDLGAVSTGCGNFYFTGGGDLMTSSATAEDFALSAAGVQSVNRASSTFWQYPNALPIESVISMSPATVGLQYSREASRGQVVLLPATAAALDPFQQAAAAALVWPSYIPQGTTSAAAAAAALQPPPNFIFPSMSSHSTLQAPQPYATSLQLFGSNYLTAAAAAAAAAAATSTLCQHNQQTNTSATNSINLSVGANGVGTASSSTMCSSSSRFLSIASTAVPSELSKQAHAHGKTAAVAHQQTAQSTLSLPPPPPPPPPGSLIMPPSTMKIEEWNATEYMTASGKTTTTTLAHQQNSLIASSGGHLPTALAHPLALNFETRDKTTTTTTTTNLLDLHGATQALNLMRLPTPPTSATMESAAAAAANVPQLQQQLVFQAANSSTPTLLNLSTTMPRAASTNGNYMSNATPPIGPPTPIADDIPISFKQVPLEATPPQIVVGVPRVMPISTVNAQPGPVPQMQDVNIQTDTPVCSEDENSSCTMSLQQQSVAPGTPPPEPASTTLEEDETMEQDMLDSQQPLELTKHNNLNVMDMSTRQPPPLECHNNTHSAVQSTTVTEQPAELLPTQVVAPTVVPLQEPIKISFNVSNLTEQTNGEDMTGLELLSNISTSTLVKSDINANEQPKLLRVKQEPIDIAAEESQEANEHGSFEATSSTSCINAATALANSASHETELLPAAVEHQHQQQQQQQQQPQTVVEPLGGLNLLCALAEQRIQEEVQSSGGSGLFCTSSGSGDLQTTFQFSSTANEAAEEQSDGEQAQEPSKSYEVEQSSFPSMEGIELPTTSGVAVTDCVKRKKHKHSKSSKSSSSKKSQRCSKKSKKKYSKEKRKHKLQAPPTADELDFEDEQLQEDLRNAFNSVDPKYQNSNKWPNPQEIFNIMEQNMRMRLADITRQYRKKKRKLDEIAKNKKKKKCSKLAAQREREREREQQLQLQQQQQQQQTTPTLSLNGSSVLALHANGNSALSVAANSQPLLCDYNFSKFAKVSATAVGVGSGTAKHSSYLQPSSFLRFAEKSHTSFPPADCDLGNEQDKEPAAGAITTGIFKPVRLEPSALATADRQRNASALRLAHKHPSSEKTSHIIVNKERKLMSRSGSANSRHSSGDDVDDNASATSSPKKSNNTAAQHSPGNSRDHELMLTNDHLYRKETRVLTDMGGLFYAGIMKPLQPPDIYAITLDGERGNKSHIMSREEIFKDTILEVAPKTVESLPVGTRLCAYWSQQYRCLYPGRVIESESSDDGSVPNDFVSVEFDDGDSGRIRLQNIRLLLSDYPIAEYNDNPLYSLGKQKKNKSQAGSNNNINEAHKAQSDQQTAHSITEEQYNKMGSLGVEMYAKRTEKKRLKRSQKKKTQAERQNNAAAASAASTPYTGPTTTTTTSTILSNGHQMLKTCTTPATLPIAESEQTENQRKHHKHKKRKKHKKHHHRKNNGDAAENGKCYMIAPVPMPYKRELSLEEEPNNNEDDDSAHYAVAEYNNNNERHTGMLDKRTHAAQSAGGMTAITTPTGATIKLETSTNGLMACIGTDVKVKTENLDIEEETTSNLMSEISDEAKGDDVVEHNTSKGSSKIAAFLPERQLWGWFGTAYRKAGVKGRARKQFYKTIKRGKETITVGECAVFLSTGRPDRPYIGRIESMWETTAGNKVVRVRWFYHPEETTGCPSLKYPGALFESPHEDENDVQTISHRCEVLEFLNYFGKFGADSKQYQSIYDNNDTYYLAGYYNPRLKVLKLQDDIPTLEELNTTTNIIVNNNNCNDYDNENDNNV